MEGQYRGPIPSMTPEKRGDRSRLARMMAWVFSLVYVMWQHTRLGAGFSVSKEKGMASSSPT